MDVSERLSAVVALSHCLQDAQTPCDLLVSAFAAAVQCGRRSTVCKPFPAHIFGPEGYDAAAAAVQDFQGLPEQLEAAPDDQLQLLQWLLLQLSRTWVVSQCSCSQFLQELQQAPGRGSRLEAAQQAACVLQVSRAADAAHPSSPPAAAQPGRRTVIAYHGTDLANMHSILHQGLLAASGTRLQTTGAVFGQGIYLSTDYRTAFQFTKGREAWRHSTIGHHLRCVLVCEVAEQALCTQATTPSGGLPTTYIVAQKPADVAIRYLLVFCDDALLGCVPRRVSGSSSAGGSRASTAGVGGRPRSAADLCWAVTWLYIAGMVLYACWKGTLPRRW